MKVTAVSDRCIFEVKICGLVPRRVFEPKVTTVKVIMISFRVFSQKNMLTGTTFQKDLVPLSGKISTF